MSLYHYLYKIIIHDEKGVRFADYLLNDLKNAEKLRLELLKFYPDVKIIEVGDHKTEEL